MAARTSATHPLRVDFIPKHEHGLDGQLGMTFAPGKKAQGIEGHWDRDLVTDLARLRQHYAADVLVSLVEEHELGKLHIQRLPTAAEAAGIVLDRFAIQDGGVPANATQFAELVRRTVAHVRAGKTVVIHCRGGLGRTGVLAAACLRAIGMKADRAMATVRAARPGTIENAAQEDFVRRVELRREDTPDHGPMLSRIRGCLLGGAVGDALGAPVEFLSLGEIRAKFGPDGVREYAPAYGRLGAITDDTQMTLFTAEGLLRAEVRGSLKGICHPPSVVHHAYIRWLATQGVTPKATVAQGQAPEKWPDGWLVRQRQLWSQRAPGNTCLSALSSAVSLGELPTNDSKGCGTVMRVAPVGMLCSRSDSDRPWSAFEMGVDVSRLTHGHRSGCLAGGFFAELIACALVLDARPLRTAISAVREVLRRQDDHEEVLRAVDQAVGLADTAGESTPERIESLGAGWVAEEALAIALYAALVARDFEHGVRLAVNHGGDSDSTGSLVGNLLGALWGLEAIPQRWLDELELRDVIDEMARDVAKLRGGQFDAEKEKARYPGW
jgi:ADP-ribosylglycohydrolase/protein-tyrosine phosphatase